MEPKFPKIIQIIPADGWYAIYREEGEKPGTFPSKIVCIALYDDGDVHFMDTDGNGYIDKAYGVGNLVGLKHEK